MFKTNFSGNNTIWGGTENILGSLPLNVPRGCGPGHLSSLFVTPLCHESV